jgi:hypothetical protein
MEDNSNKKPLRQFVILDDSGDPGVEGSRTSHFIIAAVIILGEDDKEKHTAAVDNYRKKLGWKETHEFKFNTTKKDIIEELITIIRNFKFSAYAIVLDKRKIPVTPDIIDSNSLYYYVMKELLLKLELKSPHITIDGIGGKKFMQRIRTYLRKNLKINGIEKCEIKFEDSRKNSLIQLTDIIAGSVARSFCDDRVDSREFLKMLEDKIVQIFELEL